MRDPNIGTTFLGQRSKGCRKASPEGGSQMDTVMVVNGASNPIEADGAK